MHRLALAVLAVLAASPLHAQPSAFVVRLGTDTLAIERYSRSGNRLEGDIVNRQPAVRVTHYAIELDAANRPVRATIASRRADGTPLPNAAKSATATFRNDSVWTEIVTAVDSTVRSTAKLGTGTLPQIANSYALYELGLQQLRSAKRDSGAIALWAVGSMNTAAQKVSVAGTKVTMDYFGDPVAITTDAAGRILTVDGTRTTTKVVVERLAPKAAAALDLAAIARGFQPLGVASPRDTVRAAIGGAQLWIDYGRPSVRGRTVWGGELVPFGTVWRTGANAATQFSSDRDLVIAGAAVPAGKYTLWTMPSAEGYQLVVNKQTGQWGTEYKADQDLVRVPLSATSLATPVERFTLAIEQAPNGGTIRMQWGDKQLAVPFVVKP